MYLYGGRHDDAARELLSRRLTERFPGLRIVGALLAAVPPADAPRRTSTSSS